MIDNKKKRAELVRLHQEGNVLLWEQKQDEKYERVGVLATFREGETQRKIVAALAKLKYQPQNSVTEVKHRPRK